MSDIVKRLQENTISMGHGCREVDPLCEEAANEITRLRGELKVMQAAYDKLSDEYNDLTMAHIDVIFKYLDCKVQLEDMQRDEFSGDL